MATKTKTVISRVVVFFDEDGRYMAAGDSGRGDRPDDDMLLGLSDSMGAEDLPYSCIVEIELPIPKLLVGKVRSVKAVKER